MAFVTDRPSLGSAGVIAETQPASTRCVCRVDMRHEAEPVPIVRQRLALPVTFSDDAVLSTLRAIVTKPQSPDRWRDAFNCYVGQLLFVDGRDLNIALNTLALLPEPRS
jgi:hypothetical protein